MSVYKTTPVSVLCCSKHAPKTVTAAAANASRVFVNHRENVPVSHSLKGAAMANGDQGSC